MSHLIISEWGPGTRNKYLPYAGAAAATADLARVQALGYADAFVAAHPGGAPASWIVDMAAKTVVLDTAADHALRRAALARAISAEAERRIAEGVLLPGSPAVRFRADDRSVGRLQGLLREAELADAAGEPVAIEFLTSAGVPVTVTSVAHARGLYRAVSRHIKETLSRSKGLQIKALAGELPADFDPAAGGNWVGSP